MTLFIETLPSERLLDNDWKIVAQTEDPSTVFDIIRFPDFDYTTYDLCRLRNDADQSVPAMGVFSDDGFVDLSPRSEAIHQYVWKNIEGKSFPEQWRDCDDPIEMLRIVRKIISTKILAKTIEKMILASGVLDKDPRSVFLISSIGDLDFRDISFQQENISRSHRELATKFHDSMDNHLRGELLMSVSDAPYHCLQVYANEKVENRWNNIWDRDFDMPMHPDDAKPHLYPLWLPIIHASINFGLIVRAMLASL